MNTEPTTKRIELGNIYGVARRKDRILVTCLARRCPTVDLGPLEMDAGEALNLAAYLRIFADPKGDEFARLLADIKKTGL